MKRRARYLLIVVSLLGSTAVPVSTRTDNEGVTGLPADVTPMLSLAGIWQGVPDEHVTAVNHGGISNFYAGNLRLHNGREGIVMGSWSFAGFANTDATLVPVSIALFEQQVDGTLQLATSRYVPNPLTNGVSSVVIADFNRDGVDDFVMPAWNEAPSIPADSVAFLSSREQYDRIVIPDNILAHGSTVAEINGKPTVFTATHSAVQRENTVMQFDGINGFTILSNTGIVGTSSVAVADFEGRGEYAAAFSDFRFGPNYRFDPNRRLVTYLYRLSNLLPTGNGFKVGDSYFDGKPQYQQYQSFTDPQKTHTIRLFADDFNQDGKVDLVAEAIIFSRTAGTPKNVIQMFQHDGGFAFRDVTGELNPDYNEDCFQSEYSPQHRAVDSSPITTFFIGSSSFNTSQQPACNYVLVNDGTGRLRVGLHETLNLYSEQILRWVSSSGQLPGYHNPNPAAMRAYQTPNGKVNFLAMLYATYRPSPSSDFVSRRVFVNVPLQLDLSSAFTKPMVVENRNGSRYIRTFAGDDEIRAREVSGATIDGGLGSNTVVYAGSRFQHSVTEESGNRLLVTATGTGVFDTLINVQRVVFSDSTTVNRQPN